MISLGRNILIDALVKNSQRINCVFLNHCGSPAKLHSDISTIDLLVDKDGYHDFLSFCRSHDAVKEVLLFPRFKRTKVLVKLKDGSELSLKLIRNMIHNGLSTLPIDEIWQECHTNSDGLLVPAEHHHYEYVMMKCQFSGVAFQDKYQKYFSSMDAANRSNVFRYLQFKYNFVFNTIEDLYKPKGSLLLRITVGLRALDENSLGRLVGRLLGNFAWNVVHLFLPRKKRLGPLSPEQAGKPNQGHQAAKS